jgi:hypothetical protein
MENRVSAKLSQPDQDAIIEAINTIKDKLPFLIGLTPEERCALPRLGNKSRAFMVKALEVANQSPDFLPRAFDLDEMKQDVELFESMYPIFVSMIELNQLIEDTVIEVGSEAYTAALIVYNYAQASGTGAGLDGVVDEMGKRFARKSQPK